MFYSNNCSSNKSKSKIVILLLSNLIIPSSLSFISSREKDGLGILKYAAIDSLLPFSFIFKLFCSLLFSIIKFITLYFKLLNVILFTFSFNINILSLNNVVKFSNILSSFKHKLNISERLINIITLFSAATTVAGYSL